MPDRLHARLCHALLVCHCFYAETTLFTIMNIGAASNIKK